MLGGARRCWGAQGGAGRTDKGAGGSDKGRCWGTDKGLVAVQALLIFDADADQHLDPREFTSFIVTFAGTASPIPRIMARSFDIAMKSHRSHG